MRRAKARACSLADGRQILTEKVCGKNGECMGEMVTWDKDWMMGIMWDEKGISQGRKQCRVFQAEGPV